MNNGKHNGASPVKQPIHAPGMAAVGPYSHAVRAGNLIFVSGQIPVDAATGALVPGDAGAQTAQCCKNVAAVLAAAGAGLENVVKSTVFLTDMHDFALVNAAYRAAFPDPCPARSCVAVAALPLGSLVEIEVVAAV